MRTILVTGGSGLVGSYLQRELPDAIYPTSKEFDLTNQQDIERLFSTYKPDVVVHLAAKVGGIIDNIEHPVTYLDDNLLMNTLLLRGARAHGVRQFTAILSCCAFPGECSTYPMKEEVMHDGPPDRNTFSYGLSKRIMAVQIENHNQEFGTRYNYLSPCNLYGLNEKVGENRSHFVTALIHKIKAAHENGEKAIRLFGDGTPVRQLMYAKDLARIIKHVIENEITDSFNVAAEEALTIDDIARIALKATGAEHLAIEYDTSKPNGQSRKDLDITRFKKLMPTYECMSLYDGLREYYEATKHR